MENPEVKYENKETRTCPLLAIVVPCFNEEEILPVAYKVFTDILDEMIAEGKIAAGSFIFYVDDGSTDHTWDIISSLSAANPRVGGVRLSMNSGHQHALIAGIDAVREEADIVVTIDADLQDDVSAVPRMVEEYRRGSDIVFGVRKKRDSDSWFKRCSALAFYRLMNSLGVNTIFNHSDFRLMSRRTLLVLEKFHERNLFLRGIVPMMGFRQSKIYYDRSKRMSGKSKYPLSKSINFAIDGITSFSVRPVRLVSIVGLLFVLVALGIFIYVLIRYFGGETIEGWTSLMLSIWFCTGVLLMALGIIGEYVGKIYIEVKERPRYSVEDLISPRIHDKHK